MRRLEVLLLCSAGLSCTMANPAFEGGDEFADDTRGTFEEGDTTTKPDSESGSSSAADAESDGVSTSGSSEVDGDGDGDSSTGDGDGDTNSGSTGSTTDEGSTGSTTDEGSTSSTTDEGSTSSTTDEGSSSTTLGEDLVEECALVDPADSCLACAEDVCCSEGTPDCFDPLQPCGCLLKCLLENGNQCLAQCGMVEAIDSQHANAVNACVGTDCDVVCL